LRIGHSIGILRQVIASRTPCTRSAFERMDGQRGRSSELRRRDTCEVAVGRCEHDAFRWWQFLKDYAKPRARCEPGPRAASGPRLGRPGSPRDARPWCRTTLLGTAALISDWAPMMLRVRPPQLTITIVLGDGTRSLKR